MKIEHVAFNVPEPDRQADWMVENLGFEIAFAAPPEAFDRGRFVRDSSGQMTLELYCNPQEGRTIPDYASMDPMQLHLALVSDDVDGDAARLEKAGAKILSVTHKPGLDLAMLRDPWGLPIQLCRRERKMLRQ